MKFEFSAGGVVYKNKKLDILILVAKHSQHHGWVFPKGLIGDKKEGEGKEETAFREVKEETGIEAKIEKELTPVSYWYVWEGEKIKKTVYYFLMEAIGGNIEEHDDEMEEVEWISDSKVEKRLTYPSDKKVWKEAKQLLEHSD
ncbi:MAG: NUDIX domain-containing protein [Candidatus Levybacteria bacterium]|nr:NUDIX domain-containing protein [Candidatus Levybacteria bacterium]